MVSNIRQKKRVELVRLRMEREASFRTLAQVESPREASEVFRRFMGSDGDRESCAVLCLDVKHRPTVIQIISVGTLDRSLIHPREVFKTAILANAAAIVFAHWHPSGDPEPSPEDVRITQRLMRAGELMGIELLDHLILGADSDFLSMKECGLMESLHDARSMKAEGGVPY